MTTEFSAKVWAALAAVYVIWGSTYLAIKIVVETMPPLLTAGARFFAAGLVMYAVGRAREPRSTRPTAVQWRSAAIIGTALCLGGNGFVNLAEKRGLDSGIAALIVATVPLFLALFDRMFMGTKLPTQAVVGLVIGFGGTALL
ncbi:MAG TPA: EamA family transporter, partial [Actinomycetota bacterium]|nr:EamA family transporter [Actinomycetota bacterium]